MTDSLEIRGYSDSCFPDILAAERICFSDPWSEQMLSDAVKGERCSVFTAFFENTLAGYIILLDAVDMTEILNIAVLPDMRRRGIGNALLKEAEKLALSKSHTALCLEVRVSNPAAKLYSKFGFETVSVRRNYYSDPKEDAAVMIKQLD